MDELRPMILDEMGIVESLHSLVSQERERSSTTFEFVTRAPFSRLPPLLDGTLFRIAKEYVSTGNLGMISIAISQFSGNLGLVAGTESLRWDPVENPGGPLYSYTIHLADVMEFLFGEVVEVIANCGKVGGPSKTKDSTASVLRFSSGQIAIISGSYLSPMSFTFEIQGSKANLLLSNAHMPRIQKDGQEIWESEYINLDYDFISGRKLAY